MAWFGPQRIAGPGLPPALLPPIDLLLLSHNHYDHLDLRALAQLREPGRTSVVMPLRLSRYLDTGRYAQAIELDWLQQAEVAGIRITALPAIHFSKRGLFDRNASLWCGFLLEAGGPAASCSPATPPTGRCSRRRHRAWPSRTWPWCRSAPTSRGR